MVKWGSRVESGLETESDSLSKGVKRLITSFVASLWKSALILNKDIGIPYCDIREPVFGML